MFRSTIWPQVTRPARVFSVWAATAVLLAGCRDGHELDCLKSTGKIVVERRALEPFTVVTGYDNVDITLVQDTETYAEVRAGKNLQEDIELRVENGALYIGNTSRCNWVRRYNTPREVRLHTPRITSTFLRGQADIRTEGTFSQDTIFFHLIGSGDYRLSLRSRYVGMSQYELGDIYLTGSSQELHHTLGGDGSLHATGFPVQNLYLQTNFDSNGNLHTRAAGLLAGTHAGTGTVYFTPPTPTQIELKTTGKGKVQAE